MTCNYTLQILDVYGIPNDCRGLILEVIVRTPRLLSTIRRKHGSEPFATYAARGVTVHWTQAKTAKAYVRLRLLPGDTAMDAALAAVNTASPTRSLIPTLPATDSAAAGVTQPLHTSAVATAASAVASASSAVTSEAALSRGVRKSAEVQLNLGEHHAGSSSTVAVAAATAVPHVQQLALALEPEAGSGGDRSSTSLLELNIALFTGGSTAEASFLRPPASVTAATAASGMPAVQAWAWAEVASPPLPPAAEAPEHTKQPGTPRKRSWLLALGLGRAGSGGGGGGDSIDTVIPVSGGGDTATAAGTLGGARNQATSVWDPMAALSSVTAKTAATAATETTRSWSSVPLPMSGNAATAPYKVQVRSGSSGRDSIFWGAEQPQPSARGRIPPDGGEVGGTVLSSPFGMFSQVAATSLETKETQPAGRSTASAASASATSSPAVVNEPQPPKRRRLGEFFARLVHATFYNSNNNNKVRRMTAPETGLPGSGAAGCEGTDAAEVLEYPSAGTVSTSGSPAPPTVTLSRKVCVNATTSAAATASRTLPRRRNSSPLMLTVLTPPSPRLGDVSKVQDNALASDACVQIGFEDVEAGSAAVASTAVDLGSSSGLVPGLESPGYGDTSPAGGPDRLRIEPPVNDMAAASLASPMEISPVMPPRGGCLFFWRYGSSGRARAAAAAGEVAMGRAVSEPVPDSSALTDTTTAEPLEDTGNGSAVAAALMTDPVAAESLPVAGGQRSCEGRASQVQGPVVGTALAAAVPAVVVASHPLEGQISRVVDFVSGQTEVEEELRVAVLSQCQFLLDCLRNPDMCWLVRDSLLQLKREVGFPFDTGAPITGAPGWFRLLLQPLHTTTTEAMVAMVEAPLTMAPLAPSVEVLKVRWACIDQRQVGGSNACAAVGLEVAAWCLGAVQRWRQAVSAAAASMAVTASDCGGGHPDEKIWSQPAPSGFGAGGGSGTTCGGGGQCENAVILSSSKERELPSLVAFNVEMETLSGAALELCIRSGTEVWQGVLMQSPAARVASRTGDFDLEHMLQLGGYSQRLFLADYYAASLLEDCIAGAGGGGQGDGPRRCNREIAAVTEPPHMALSMPEQPPPGAELSEAQVRRKPRPLVVSLQTSIKLLPLPPLVLQVCASGAVNSHGNGRARRGSHCGLPSFATLVRSLPQGVYVLGWRGHFATLWLRCGGVVHLIDSLGARLAPDCPLAFILEFNTLSDFILFFLARHQARREATLADDFAMANMAVLIEVHRLELL